MHIQRKLRIALAVGLLISAQARLRAAENVDLAVINRIRTEALTKSQVMDHMFYLSEVYGPRLTNSPRFDAATKWVAEQSKKWGLQNVALEKWGPFGRGWQADK